MSCGSKKRKVLTVAACLLSAALICAGGIGLLFANSRSGEDDVGGNYSGYEYLGGSQRFLPIAKNYAELSYDSISAKAAILIEESTGEVIFEKNADAVLPMASTTKIMTALVAIENCDISKEVSIPNEAVGVEGSSIYLYADEKLTVESLLYALMLESANDAAVAIAISVSGTVEDFAALMNKKADELGLHNTHFTNPHGLDHQEHHTTARELAIISRAAMQNPVFRRIVSTHKKTIPLNQTEGVRLLINHNKMLKGYEGACGIKTGYTKKSGRCLVSSAERDGVSLISVTLNAPNDWSDHTKLLDHGFSLYRSELLYPEGGFKYTLPVIAGEQEYVILQNKSEIRVTLPRDCGELQRVINLPRFIFAPVSKGDRIGSLVYMLDGEIVAECDIVAAQDIPSVIYKKGFFGK